MSTQSHQEKPLREIAEVFLRLGATAFGGPAAHIAMMEREIVEKRGWVSRQHFLDLLGATNLIPGPNSTELAIHLGYERGGWRGLITAGVCFIAPAFFIVLGIAAFYEKFSALPHMKAALHGMSPVVVAIIAHALWKFFETALKNVRSRFAAFLCALLLLTGASELTALGATAIFGLLCGWRDETPLETDSLADEKPRVFSRRALFFGTLGVLSVALIGWILQPSLFLSFAKIGSVLYGSGYVLLAFLQSEFVPRVLTQNQLLDAVAIGQVTPGPVFTAATFVGYQIDGWRGAVASTFGIFLPSFVFVALLSVFMRSLKTSRITRAFLDAVNAASLILMAYAALLLGQSGLTNWIAIIAFLLALTALFKTKINPAWLLAAGAILGLVTHIK